MSPLSPCQNIDSARLEAQTRAIPNLERFYAVPAIAQIIKNCKVLWDASFSALSNFEFGIAAQTLTVQAVPP
jgi:hypothetical protein